MGRKQPGALLTTTRSSMTLLLLGLLNDRSGAAVIPRLSWCFKLPTGDG